LILPRNDSDRHFSFPKHRAGARFGPNGRESAEN